MPACNCLSGLSATFLFFCQYKLRVRPHPQNIHTYLVFTVLHTYSYLPLSETNESFHNTFKHIIRRISLISRNSIKCKYVICLVTLSRQTGSLIPQKSIWQQLCPSAALWGENIFRGSSSESQTWP